MKNEEILKMIDDCQMNTEEMSDWEIGFVDDMSSRISKGEILSKRQINKLNEVHKKVSE